ncbi:hypothetical protein F383_37654 [Gossypium arboreum]|uniref:Uncharacterized protein n=1 Tax=Gossypium arboreum TaxID=29729 RepID=A0A0B0MHU5_GOSAR|nr:hypothetical protein F383_37654 [Gossypium arboreum]
MQNCMIYDCMMIAFIIGMRYHRNAYLMVTCEKYLG